MRIGMCIGMCTDAKPLCSPARTTYYGTAFCGTTDFTADLFAPLLALLTTDILTVALLTYCGPLCSPARTTYYGTTFCGTTDFTADLFAPLLETTYYGTTFCGTADFTADLFAPLLAREMKRSHVILVLHPHFSARAPRASCSQRYHLGRGVEGEWGGAWKESGEGCGRRVGGVWEESGWSVEWMVSGWESER